MKKLIVFSSLFLICLAGIAQKLKWEKGEDLSFVKNVSVFKVQYAYNDLTVADGSEQAFLDERRAEMNKDKAGEGDEFVNNWQKAKTEKYPKHFEETFAREFKKEGITASQQADAPYTIIIRLRNIKTGKGSMWGKKPAELDFTISFVDTKNPATVLAVATMEDVKGEVKAPKGSGWMPGGVGSAMQTTAHFVNKEVTNRLAESFELVAKAICKQIDKKR